MYIKKGLVMKSEGKISQTNSINILVGFVLKPVGAGLYGFSGFFLVIVISKYLGTVIGTINSFNVDISDVELSLLGFFFVFLINLLKNFQNFNR